MTRYIIPLRIVNGKSKDVKYLLYAEKMPDGSYATQYRRKDGTYSNKMVELPPFLEDSIELGIPARVNINIGEMVSIG